MTDIELEIEVWRLNFQSLWMEHCYNAPSILKGTTPIKDMMTANKVGSVGISWFYYNSRKYDEDYWDAFGLIMNDKYDSIDYGVATTEYFTNLYDLGYEDGDDVPDLVLLCVDIPGIRRTF